MMVGEKPRRLCNLVMHEITVVPPRIVVVCGAVAVGLSFLPLRHARGKCSAFFAGKLVRRARTLMCAANSRSRKQHCCARGCVMCE